MSQDQPIAQNHRDLKQKYDLQIIKQKLNSTQLNSQVPQLFFVGFRFPTPQTIPTTHLLSLKLLVLQPPYLGGLWRVKHSWANQLLHQKKGDTKKYKVGPYQL